MSLWWRAAAPEGLIGGVEEPVTHVSVQGGVPMREDTPSGMHLSHSCRGDPATCQSCHRQQLGYCLSRLHQHTTLVAQYMRWSWCAELQWKALENGECSDTQLEAGDFSRALSFIHCCQCCSCFMWESWDAQGVGGGGGASQGPNENCVAAALGWLSQHTRESLTSLLHTGPQQQREGVLQPRD